MTIPKRHTYLVLAASLAAASTVLYAWRLPPFRTAVETTDNAYVRGNVTVIAPKVDGYVASVLVMDFQHVQKGQALVQLDRRIYAQRLEQARGNLSAQEANLANVEQARRVREAAIAGAEAAVAAAHAQQANAVALLERAQADQQRNAMLVDKGFVSARERDRTDNALSQAQAAVKVTLAGIRQANAARAAAEQDLRSVIVNRRAIEAAVESARAAVALAEIDLENTTIRAPGAGHVGEVGVKLGQYVVPGTQLLALVPSQVWLVANFKESQTARMKPGQPVTFRVDALGNAELPGSVERIAPATGSEFSVIRPDNATGNFTRIVQRLPVRISIDPSHALAQRLRPGMSVVVRVDTR
jgi:multidrug resistance efflux pump